MDGPRGDQVALGRLFRAALDDVFSRQPSLWSPLVADHLADEVLGEFVHMDSLYRLRGADGERVEDLPDMLRTAAEPEGPERRLEVDRYIGDWSLFMVSFFPSNLECRARSRAEPLVARVGKLFIRFSKPVDYHVAEGRNAYGRAARTARLFQPEQCETYSLLADRFDGYRDLMSEVKRLLSDRPEVRRLEESLD